MNQNLIGKNIVVYDLETKENPGKVGWKSWARMGISVGCSYDFRNDSFGVYLDDNMHELVNRLNEPETIIVAFNQINFDNALLRGCPNRKGAFLKPEVDLMSYDMMVESKRAALGNPNKIIKGFKLDDHLSAMKLDMKTACGSFAPVMHQEGRIGELIDYCLNDVRVERNLFIHICEHRWVETPLHGRHEVKLPTLLQQGIDN